MNINRIPIVRSIMARRKACKEEEAAKRLREGYLKQGSKGPKKKVDVMGAARIKKIQARKEKKAERLFVEGGGAERKIRKEAPVIYYHGQLNTGTKFTDETRSQKKRRKKKERNEAALRKGEDKRRENDWLFRL